MSRFVVFFIISLLGVIAQSQITTDNTTFTVDQLIDGVLFESGCTTIANVQSSTGIAPGQNGIAYFQRGTSNFPLEDGIILSTGNALNAAGPNSQAGRSDVLGTPGDPDLEAVMAAAGSPLNSQDVTWISFDFVPIASNISFDYLFASEEYNGNFECQFADAFAFILTDSVTGDVTNLAIIPGTTTPVQVITVRDPPANACNPVNPSFFGDYNLAGNTFGGNPPIPSLGNLASNSPIEFNGQTVLFTAESPVIPNRSYNIKLVIGDATDSQFDSAVFIEGGSFDIGVDLGESRTITGGNPLCVGDVFTIDASLLPGTPATYVWTQTGTVIQGETSATLDVTEGGFYSVEITFATGCTSTASLFLQFVDLPDASPPDAISCDPSGVGSFDLTIIESTLLTGLNAANYTVTFYESLIDAENQVNIIPAVANYQGLSNPQTLFVRVEDNLFGCEVIYPFQLIVDDVFAAPVQDIVGCDDDTDGITTVTLADFDPLVGPGYTPGTVTISYYASQADADADVNPLGATFTNTVSPEIIYARVVATNDTGCFDTTSINIVVNVEPLAAQSISDLTLCDDNNPGDGMEIFDLTSVESDIVGAQIFTGITISYHTSQNDADNNTSVIITPTAYENISNPQTVFVRLENNLTGCFNTETNFDLNVNDAPVITVPALYDLCDDNTGDGFTTFDLISRNNEITGGNTGVTVFYYATQLDATNRMNELTSPFTNTMNPQSLFVVVENNVTGCINSTELDLEVIDAPQAITPPSIIVCDDNNTGDLIETFNLTDNEVVILNGQTGVTITYHNSQVDADSGMNAIGNITSFDNTATPQTIFVRVENTTGCFNITDFEIIVNEVPVPQLFELYFLCLNSAGGILITADSPPTLDTGLNSIDLNFTWQLDGNLLATETSATLTAMQVGMYTVTATNQVTGCKNSQTTEVRQLGPPDDFGATVTTRFFDEQHRIEAFATGPATQYIFRLDDGPWQYNGIFNDVTPGAHIVVIRDLEGCASVEIPLDVIGFPRYFTPNNDGYHDTWNIIGINDSPSTIIYIFDRYGKLLKQLDPAGIGWDGTYNGQPLPSSDYWFKVEYEENGVIKSLGGHFALKR